MGSNLVEGGVVRKCLVASKAADTHTCGGLGRSLQEREERSPQTGVSLHKGLWDAEVLVAQSCTTLCNPWTSPLGSVYGILQARILEWLPFPSPGILPTQASDSGLLHYKPILYCLSHWVSCGMQSYLIL